MGLVDDCTLLCSPSLNEKTPFQDHTLNKLVSALNPIIPVLKVKPNGAKLITQFFHGPPPHQSLPLESQHPKKTEKDCLSCTDKGGQTQRMQQNKTNKQRTR